MSELSDTIYEMRVEEASESLVSILDPIYKMNPRIRIKKAILIPKVSKHAYDERRKEGYNYQKTVENHLVRGPNSKFVDAHWTSICLYCADEMKMYVVWGDSGVRLGTLEEYQNQQECIENIASGVASSHNKRAEIINKRGGESVYINVNILQLPEGE